MRSKILAPTDFSPSSAQALRVAIRIARERGSTLMIVHAWTTAPLAFGIQPVMFLDALQRMSDEAKLWLDAAVRDAKQAGVEHVAGTMLTGMTPWARIVDAAERDGEVDLIVMSTHGRTGLGPVLLGSVTTQVVRHAPCSVLVVRSEHEPRPYAHALVPVDFSPGSRAAIDQAARLVETSGPGITMLHVLEPPVMLAGEAYELPMLGYARDAATKALDDLAHEARDRVRLPVTTRVQVGHAGTEILALLDGDPTFDLVVTGSHGRSGLARVLLGSVAETVVRHARCSVLVARSRGDTPPG